MKKQMLLALSLPVCLSAASAAPKGKIGFIGSKGIEIWNPQTGKTKVIPGSAKANNFTLSPRGEAVFFVPTGKKNKDSQDLANGYLAAAPYSRATPIKGLKNMAPYSFTWDSSGKSLYLHGYEWNKVFSPAIGAIKPLSFKASGFDGPAGFDAKGRLLGYTTETDVVVRDTVTGKQTILFSTKKPKPIFDALRRAKNPKNVKDLLEGEEMQKEPYAQWQIAGPAISPDGKRAYFASNCGTGYGAAGNGMQGYFACDLKTGRLSVLSIVGSDFGRPPEMTISPDGKRLLSVLSVHDSAADNSSVASIIDLETQKTRELIYSIPGSKDKANFYGGAAWSPDGKYLALSAYFYDADKAMDSLAKDQDWEETPASAWKTIIFEAANGKIWGIKPGAQAPGWSR